MGSTWSRRRGGWRLIRLDHLCNQGVDLIQIDALDLGHEFRLLGRLEFIPPLQQGVLPVSCQAFDERSIWGHVAP